MLLAEQQLSPEAKMKVEITGGKIMLSADLDTAGMDAAVTVAVDSDYFLDELAKKIPGTIDDAIIAVLKTALKAL